MDFWEKLNTLLLLQPIFGIFKIIYYILSINCKLMTEYLVDNSNLRAVPILYIIIYSYILHVFGVHGWPARTYSAKG